MSKNPKPTTEELRFVYDLILKGSDDADVLSEYAERYENGTLMFPPRTDKRFVRDRRKELEAARAALETSLKKVVDPVIVHSKERHFKDLADVANSLLDGGLEKITDDYSIMHEGYREEKLNKSELTGRLEGNLDVARQRYSPKKVISQFFDHVEFEYTGQDIYGLISTNPLEFVSIMSLLAERKTFKGTCPVCKDW